MFRLSAGGMSGVMRLEADGDIGRDVGPPILGVPPDGLGYLIRARAADIGFGTAVEGTFARSLMCWNTRRGNRR